jgi:hypothetical protein
MIMLYRRHPYINRQYMHNNVNVHAGDMLNPDVVGEPQRTVDDIPLPNEEPLESPRRQSTRKNQPFSFLNFFMERIGIEEILLLGLLFILLQEGIDDEFLIIILLYVLITGIE